MPCLSSHGGGGYASGTYVRDSKLYCGECGAECPVIPTWGYRERGVTVWQIPEWIAGSSVINGMLRHKALSEGLDGTKEGR